MSDLCDAPGYADMIDYYQSDYDPTDLVRRYDALREEERRWTAQRFVAATQAHGLAATVNAFDQTVDAAPPLTDTSASLSERGTRRQEQQQQRHHPRLSAGQRSPQRPSSQTHSVVAEEAGKLRRGPRTSVALDEIYAARAVSHGYTGAGTAPPKKEVAAAAAAGPSRAASSAGVSRTTPVALPRAAASAASRAAKRQLKAAAVEKEAVPVPRDLYDSAAELRRQEQFFSESKRLGKPFVPSGGSGLDLPTRFMLGDCVKRLYRSIALDWREASPMVVTTAEDLIAVYFSIEKLEKSRVTALLGYMNASLLHNGAIREFHLTKVSEGWDVLTDDGFVLYTFRPPWVKRRVFLPDTVSPAHAHLRDGES